MTTATAPTAAKGLTLPAAFGMGAAMSLASSSRCADCLARDLALCAALGDEDLRTLSAIGRRKTVPRGTVISWAGDENGLCASIVSGALKVSASTADGREQGVGLLFAGDFVGQPFATTNSVTTVALADSDLCVYPRGAFERVLGDQPKLERALLQRTIASLNEARERQLMLARKGARERVASFLDALSRHSADPTIEVPVSRGEIADYLGLTIETVSRQFTHLKTAGVIDFEKGGRMIRIVSRDALLAATGD